MRDKSKKGLQLKSLFLFVDVDNLQSELKSLQIILL